MVDSIKSSDALAWNMTSDSNMKNYDSATDSGISPGSYGSLSFLVKPKDASINLDLTFQIVGYTYTAESTDEVTNEVTPESMEPIDNDDISAYLGGHIFLFQKRNIEYYKDGNNQDTDKIKKITYSDPILPQNGSYNRVISDRTFTKATEDTPVVIYWVWPKTLSTLVDAHENDNVSIEPFCSPSSTSYSSIVTDIKTNPTRYFYGYDSNGITLTEDKLVSDYDYYGSMYDQADNEIGKGVNFITVKMTTNESVVAVSP
ncbi:hypothetical protein [Ruminococcus flavefaciens]|uniref:hypothetical protein n=1 Tax=Ruminococcus flavefaciens TaxID=1265 RepID=UPI003F035F53